MNLNEGQLSELDQFFDLILHGQSRHKGKEAPDRACKRNQILDYIEIIDAHIRKLSRKRTLTFIDFAAGNCYLSFLTAWYYNNVDKRPVEIFCIDRDERLLDNCSRKAVRMGFNNMEFHGCDILDFSYTGKVDISFSLHACDTATDKAIYQGLRLASPCILSVSCCQHSLKKQFKTREEAGWSGFRAMKDRLLYMTADTMRGRLLEMEQYNVDLFDFTSSRNTDKNLMIRARREGSSGNSDTARLRYDALKKEFSIEPELACLMKSKTSLLKAC